jgi:hypothetical protein
VLDCAPFRRSEFDTEPRQPEREDKAGRPAAVIRISIVFTCRFIPALPLIHPGLTTIVGGQRGEQAKIQACGPRLCRTAWALESLPPTCASCRYSRSG